MTTPDELAVALLPPESTDAARSAAQLRITDAAMALGEHLLAELPAGRHLDAALAHLVRTAQAAYAGMLPALVPYDRCGDLADRPVPYALTEQAREHPDVDHVDHVERVDPGDPLVLDVGVWRLGITTSGMHPLTRLVAMVLAESCAASGFIPDAHQPTLRELSARSGLTLRDVHHHLSDLCTGGWVSRHATTAYGARRTRYQLRLPGALTR